MTGTDPEGESGSVPAKIGPGVGRMTVDDLADELGLHPGDVRVLLSWLDPENGGLHPDGTLLNEYGGAVRDQFDHLCERTVPAYWWPGSDPEAGKGATKMI